MWRLSHATCACRSGPFLATSTRVAKAACMRTARLRHYLLCLLIPLKPCRRPQRAPSPSPRRPIALSSSSARCPAHLTPASSCASIHPSIPDALCAACYHRHRRHPIFVYRLCVFRAFVRPTYFCCRPSRARPSIVPISLSLSRSLAQWRMLNLYSAPAVRPLAFSNTHTIQYTRVLRTLACVSV